MSNTKLREGICHYCGERKTVAPLSHWDNEEMISYFCRDHYMDAAGHYEKDKQGFLEYYKDPVRRSWLSPKNLALYNRLSKGE
jgi:hypothetical protein